GGLGPLRVVAIAAGSAGLRFRARVPDPAAPLPFGLPELARRLVARKPLSRAARAARRSSRRPRARDGAFARSVPRGGGVLGRPARDPDAHLAELPDRRAVARGHGLALVPRTRVGGLRNRAVGVRRRRLLGFAALRSRGGRARGGDPGGAARVAPAGG